MTIRLAAAACLMFSTVLAFGADEKEFCPPMPTTSGIQLPPPPDRPSAAPAENAEYVGSVTVMMVLSARGDVCSVKVLRGISKPIDRKVVTASRGWQFDPSRKNEEPVSVVVMINAYVWRDEKGTILVGQGPHVSK